MDDPAGIPCSHIVLLRPTFCKPGHVTRVAYYSAFCQVLYKQIENSTALIVCSLYRFAQTNEDKDISVYDILFFSRESEKITMHLNS